MVIAQQQEATMEGQDQMDTEADPIVLAASVTSTLVGAFIGSLVAGPFGMLIGGVFAGGTGALITKSIELRAEMQTLP
jgi:predicted lipid-binding transport protein (Tim44 family)